MRVSVFDKQLRKSIASWINWVGFFLSLLFSVVEWSSCCKTSLLGVCAVTLLLFYIGMWINACLTKSLSLKINGNDVNIICGDLFLQNGIKLIPFNEYLDTEVDDIIITTNSLHGHFIKHQSVGTAGLDFAIENNEYLKEKIVEVHSSRPGGGKTTRYQLGSVLPLGNYFILAFSRFNDKNEAYLTKADYVTCLIHMWQELGRYYNKKPIFIPLLGSGITRFNDKYLEPRDYLQYILLTLKISDVKFEESVTIVLDKKNMKKTNLKNLYEFQYDLKD